MEKNPLLVPVIILIAVVVVAVIVSVFFFSAFYSGNLHQSNQTNQSNQTSVNELSFNFHGETAKANLIAQNLTGKTIFIDASPKALQHSNPQSLSA
jgi:flagellar basal body-associated protein FliL